MTLSGQCLKNIIVDLAECKEYLRIDSQGDLTYQNKPMLTEEEEEREVIRQSQIVATGGGGKFTSAKQINPYVKKPPCTEFPKTLVLTQDPQNQIA